MTLNPPYVGRFAPSPTGPLHFGSLVAAVASYADARAAGGRWLLRIEDVDTPRCTRAAEVEILRQLAVYGFEADATVIRQSERYERFESALAQLAHDDRLFACACTRKMLGSAPHNALGEIIYPGRCRDRAIAVSAPATALRLRVQADANAPVAFTDRALGGFTQSLASEVGDFILRRADGLYAYQLAVVVDDAEQDVTDVVRGADLLMNTPRQIYLQRLLGYATPGYLHVPVAKNDEGEKLSKQTRAAAIANDNRVATLKLAWAFLSQSEMGCITSVAHFWRKAIAHWNPALMRPAEGSFRVPDNTG